MFNFLKKKLKIFEKNLEDEIEAELKKDATKEAAVQPEPVPAPEVKPEPKPVSQPEPAPVEPTRRRAFRLRKEPSPPAQTRAEQQDRQIQEGIESELQRAVATRRSIEQTVTTEKKPSRMIDQKKLDELLWDLEMGLLEADVAYSVIDSIKKDIRNEISTLPFDKTKAGDFIETVLKHAIAHILQSNNFNFDTFLETHEKPIVIMFVGVNGTGKTLSIAKMAALLQKKGKTCVMAAGDTFRAGAIEQLSIHADRVGVKIIKHGPGADPAAVAFDAIEHAAAKHKDVVLLDTAGRMQTNANLMDEMAKIKRIAKPDLIIFVGDALSGNDAVEQAKRFNEVVGIDGVILTKVDADAKGGSSLSIAYTIGKPLLFVGVGQGYEDQIPFDPEWMIKNIFE